jgi:ubiquinone/menaquinone biosynthesis C-methylase UbiE
MGKRGWGCIVGVLVGGALAAAGWRLYGQRSVERLPSQESLDDPEVARAYGWVARTPQMRLLRKLVARRAMAVKDRGEALDVGCGPGLLVMELARQAPGLHVTGLDLSEEMLEQAAENARRAGLAHRVAFRIGDAQQIPLPARSVDLVVSTLSLHHWSDPLAVLDEMARVLRPGGTFLVFDLRRDWAAPFWLGLWVIQRLVVPQALRRVNEPSGSRAAAYTPAEAAQLAGRSQLGGWRISTGPIWLVIEGRAEA